MQEVVHIGLRKFTRRYGGNRKNDALPGGDLRIRWDEESGHVFMTGPAVTAFDGELAD